MTLTEYGQKFKTKPRDKSVQLLREFQILTSLWKMILYTLHFILEEKHLKTSLIVRAGVALGQKSWGSHGTPELAENTKIRGHTQMLGSNQIIKHGAVLSYFMLHL